jgi:transposase
MGNERTPGKPTTRRYSPEEKARAVRLVRQLRKELGTSHGTIQRVADQIGCGVESLRTWVKQADIDEGVEPGVTTAEAKRVRELEQEVRGTARGDRRRGCQLACVTA